MASNKADTYIENIKARQKRFYINAAPTLITNERFKTSPRNSHGDDTALYLAAYLSQFTSPDRHPQIDTKPIARKLEKLFGITYAVPIERLELNDNN
jgi:hypothetical protein